MVPAGTLGAVRKHLAKAANRLTFPRAYLVSMHLVRGRDLLHRPVAPLGFQRHPGLEISREPASFAHLCIPPLSGGIHLKTPVGFSGTSSNLIPR